MSTVTSSSSTNSSTSATTTAITNNQDVLGKNDFMKLLITQMQNQDPTQPQDDTQTVAQLAQFSSLEQMQNMNTTTLATQATDMIGTNVTWTDSSGVVQSGKVSAVNFVTGQTPTLQVGTLTVASDQVTQVSLATSAANTSTTAGS